MAKGVNNDLQERSDELIREDLFRSVYHENRKNNFGFKNWWDAVNRITGRKSKQRNISSITNPQFIKTRDASKVKPLDCFKNWTCK